MLLILDEARAHLGFEEGENADDQKVLDLIAGVVSTLDSQLGLVIDQAPRSWIFDRFEDLFILPGLPVVPESVVVSYLDSSGSSQVVAGVRVVSTGKFTRILPAIGSTWPAPADAAGVVTVSATVGYVAEDVAAESSDGVPADLKTVGKLLIGHWFENREAVGQKVEAMPMGVQMLLDPYCRRRV